jgi:hypothetical protein
MGLKMSGKARKRERGFGNERRWLKVVVELQKWLERFGNSWKHVQRFDDECRVYGTGSGT